MVLSQSDDLTQVGTECYKSPESYKADNNGPAVDIFSFGFIVFELVFERVELLSKKEIKAGKRPQFLNSDIQTQQCLDIIRLVEECWKQEPNERPNDFTEIKQRLSTIKSQTLIYCHK